MRLSGFTLFLVAGFLIGGCAKDEIATPPAGPKYSLTDFAPSVSCSTCHPQYYEEWKGSMHRYATNDPIWMLANNSLQQSTQGRLQTWCFQCHSPIGFLTGAVPGTFQFSDLPDIVREGVSCDVCHVMTGPHTTTDQNVQYNLFPGRRKRGTLSDPVATGFHESVTDASFGRSELCRECHDLIVNQIPLEVTFSEWQNSAWGAMSVECQDCHMQRYAGRAAVNGPVRNDLHRHNFVGVDVAITDFPYKADQRAAIDSLLKNAGCMNISTPGQANVHDTVQLSVTVCNDRTGHNLPTSVFFNRQMWLEVTVSEGVDTVYRSGSLDANGDLMDDHSELQPSADPDLTLFAGRLYKNGHETNVFELDSLVNNSIPPFSSRTSNYSFTLPHPGVWDVNVRLLFRPFPPYLFRSLGAQQYLAELPIFEMIVQQATIHVQ